MTACICKRACNVQTISPFVCFEIDRFFDQYVLTFSSMSGQFIQHQDNSSPVPTCQSNTG